LIFLIGQMDKFKRGT